MAEDSKDPTEVAPAVIPAAGADGPPQRRRAPLSRAPRHRPIRRGAGRGVAGTPHRGAFEQLLQHFALGWVEPVDQIGDLFAAAHSVLEGDLPRVPWQRRTGIGAHLHRGLAPGYGALLEVIQRADHVRFGSAVADQR